MTSRRRGGALRRNSAGPRSFFISGHQPQEVGIAQEGGAIQQDDDFEEVVTALLVGNVALIASETSCLVAEIRGRLHPALLFAGIEVNSGVRKSAVIPLRGDDAERRREIRGQLEYALNPPRID